MSSWAALHLPSLALDVFARGWSAEAQAHPFVVDSGGHYPRIVAANEAARRAGIRAPMLLSAALALAPDLAQQPRDQEAERAALEQLATFLLRFTPAVSLAPPSGLVAEIGSSLKLFGGRTKLLGRIVRGIEARGYAMQLAVAPTPTAALALARANGGAVVDSHESLDAALAPLALAHFDIDDAVRDTLAAAGVRTFGDAQRLPRAGLARRFGPALVDTIDRASGRAADPREPFEPPPKFLAKLELPACVHDVEALSFAIDRLVHELAAWLAARGLGVSELSLELAHERARVRDRASPRTEARFALGAPSRTPAHLTQVLRERLARLALPAPVAGIALASEAVAPTSSRNLGLLPGDEAQTPDVPLLDRLRARLGEDAVQLVAPRAEHRPERASDAVPARATARRPRESKRNAASSPALLLSPARPLWLLSEPQPLAHLIETKPWVLREGPERIESGWWDGGDVRRDYFVAESPNGEIVWIYRDHRYGVDDGEWFLHGVFA